MTKYLPFVTRNLARNKLRSLLTASAISLSIALLCILRTLPEAADVFLRSVTSDTRVSTHNHAGIFYGMPYAHLKKVREMPHVVAAISWQWFGGAVDPATGVTFSNFAVDPDDFGLVYEDWQIPPQALDDFGRYRDAAIVGRAILERNGWQVGDLVTLQSTVFPLRLSFRIVGEIPNEILAQFYFQREYLVQALAASGVSFDTVEMITSRIDDPESIEPVMMQIDEMFRNSDAETRSETERALFTTFLGSLNGILALILIVVAIITTCIVFIAANTASISVRERMNEIAILKAIGFRRQTIFGTLLVEAVLLATAAGAVGVVISLALTSLLRSTTDGSAPGGIGALSGFVVTNAILVEGLFVAFFVGLVAGWLPAFGAARRSCAQTMRQVF
jgi:putative ABC transport system permease protein